KLCSPPGARSLKDSRQLGTSPAFEPEVPIYPLPPTPFEIHTWMAPTVLARHSQRTGRRRVLVMAICLLTSASPPSPAARSTSRPGPPWRPYAYPCRPRALCGSRPLLYRRRVDDRAVSHWLELAPSPH